MNEGQSFKLNDDCSLYIGTQGAGHVIRVAGALYLMVIHDHENTSSGRMEYTVKDFVTGFVLHQGELSCDPYKPTSTAEPSASIKARIVKLMEELQESNGKS